MLLGKFLKSTILMRMKKIFIKNGNLYTRRMLEKLRIL